ncbi:MAG: hypothetical protein HYU78_08490 [Rhodocyclales bacterium]|nr:hypothetical protein [Rhodocyclales bacterium]
MNHASQEFPAISGSDAQRALQSGAAEPPATRRDADDNDADIRGVAVLGYN